MIFISSRACRCYAFGKCLFLFYFTTVLLGCNSHSMHTLCPFLVHVDRWCEVGIQLQSFTFVYPVVQESLIEKTILDSFYYLGTRVENKFTIDMWVYF